MRELGPTRKFNVLVCLLLTWAPLQCRVSGQTSPPRVISVEPERPAGAELLRRGADPQSGWSPATTDTNYSALHPGDRLRVKDNGRAAVLWTDNTVIRLDHGFQLELPELAEKSLIARLGKGIAYFFHRDKPGAVRVQTSTVSLTVRGTEFTVEVAEDGTAQVSVIDGEVVMSNDRSTLALKKGEGGLARVDKTLQGPVAIDATNIIQWCLYYPGILYLENLRLSPQEQQALSDSMNAYRAGDLAGALARFPNERQPESDDERIYLAALRLSVGQVDRCIDQLGQLSVQPGTDDRLSRLAEALRQVIAAVKHERRDRTLAPILATEWLAESYYQQSRASEPEGERRPAWELQYYGRRKSADRALQNSLRAAQIASTDAPDWDFAWVRRAELEFSFGQAKSARRSLGRVIKPSLMNAQAFALEGFLAAARNRWSEATDYFEQAIRLDGGLGNGWLGLGLVKIRQGKIDEGLMDLQMAAAVEPQRSLLRSYLGKGYYEAAAFPSNPLATLKRLFGERPYQTDLIAHATNELALAKRLDPLDPTPLLYSALIDHQQHRINEAIDDLEQSIELNDNRHLFRSQFLLDEDRAVRSSSLANVYQDAGMPEVSVREASRAVSYDYANYSAHQFLSESYNALRDPTRFNLRYETVWFNELLLANLLSPVGGTPLSQNISQQEYSRLFEQNRIGLSSSTEYRSDGQVHELASQFGNIGNTGWSLDLDYHHNDGVRPNNDLNSIEWYSTIKQQLTPQDSLLLLTKYQDYHSGDNFQYYNPTNARPNFHFDEYQSPIALIGYHHEWQPGVHTLLLGGRLVNEQHLSDRSDHQNLLLELSNGQIYGSVPGSFDVDYHNDLEIYTVEVNQIWQWSRAILSVGARYQSGSFGVSNLMDNPSGPPPPFFSSPPGTPTNSAFSDNIERIVGYGYLTWEPFDHFWLTGGLAYDDLGYPHNFRNVPISSGEDHRSQFGPKAALVWNPMPQVTLRGVFTHSLGGVSLDESYRLEPTQLGGFPQAFRTLVSESVVGSVSAPKYKTYGLALELKSPTRTYVGVQAERLEADVRRDIGVFVLPNGVPPFLPDSTIELLGYRENAIFASVNQFLGDQFVVGASYKFTQVQLHDLLPDVPVSALPTADQTQRSDLHQASGYLLFNHPSGFFARAETRWYHQRNSGNASPGPGDDFYQQNLFAGYRFARRRAEIQLGILNLTDQGYRLNPLTVYAELPRERVFFARFSFRF